MTEARRERSSFAVGLLLIAVAALAIRVLFVVVVDPKVPELGDATAYHMLAENLADGDGYIRPFDKDRLGVTRPTAEYPPLFPSVVAVPAFVGVHSVEGQRLFVAFIGAGTVVLIGLLGRRLGGDRCGLVAGAIAACYPMLFLGEATLMAESLSVPLATAVVLLAYRVIDKPAIARAVALGAGLGLLTLARAEGLLLGVVLLIGLAWRLRMVELRQRLFLATAALGVMLCLVAPWTVRNAVRLHAFIPVSNNVATLVDGANCDSVYGGDQVGLWRGTFGPDAQTQPQAQACFEGFAITDPDFDEADAATMHRKDGTKYATDHVSSLPKVAVARVLRTWALFAPRQQVNFESLEGRPRDWQMAGTVMFWVLLPFAIGGLVLLARRRIPVWPLHATVITVTVVAALTYGQQRFRVNAEPVIVACAAVAIVAIVTRLRRPVAP